jgi:hypothetical protein
MYQVLRYKVEEKLHLGKGEGVREQKRSNAASLDDIPGRSKMNFYHTVQIGFGVHPVSYPMGTGGETAGIRGSAKSPLPHASSWRVFLIKV